MANTNPIRRGVTVINPMFYIPEGVDELVYDDLEDSSNEYFSDEQDDELQSLSSEDETPDEDDDDLADAPETPDILAVVSQTIRTNAAGNQVVDLILEVEDIKGLSKYDFKVAKV